MKLTTVPSEDGFRMPAEYGQQARSIMIWPERPDNWRDGAKPAQQAYAMLANLIVTDQPVTMLVNEDQYQNARRMLDPRVQVLETSSNDAWIKDYGPFFVTNRDQVRAVNFNFNAWGGLVDGLYFPWDKDNEIAVKVADGLQIDHYDSPVTLEGCAIHTDGVGTIYATEDVVLNPDRNPTMTKPQMEHVLAESLGARKVIWLQHGYFLDETGGDVDNLINVVAPGEVVLTWTNDQHDPIYDVCRDAEQRLKRATDAMGRHLNVHRIQIPRQLTLNATEAATVDYVNGQMPRTVGQRLTATYVSYVTTNHLVIMPAFDDPQDEMARVQLASLYPDRQVLSLPAREILIGGGGLHTVVTGVPLREAGS